jgi:alpha-1,2-mannosyltransferase
MEVISTTGVPERTSGSSDEYLSAPRRVRILRRVPWAVTVPFFLVAILNLTAHSRGDDWRHAYDLDIYLQSLREFLRGGSPYGYSTPSGLGFTYPPIAIALFLPLAGLATAVVWPVWVTMIAILGVSITHWLTRQQVLVPSHLQRAFAAAIVAFTDPINDSMWLGQLSPFIGAAAFLAVAGARPRSATLAGIGGALKITPLSALVAFWLLRDRWKRIAFSLSAAVALTVLGFVFARDASVYYWTDGLWDTRRVGSVTSPSNSSLPGLLAHAGMPDQQAILLGVGVTGLLCLVYWWFAFRGRRVDRVVLAVAIGCVSLLATPVSWGHHALAVSLGLAVLALRGRWLPALAGAMVWSLPLFAWAGHLHGVPQLTLQSVRPLSAIGLVWLLAQHSRRLSLLPMSAGEDGPERVTRVGARGADPARAANW